MNVTLKKVDDTKINLFSEEHHFYRNYVLSISGVNNVVFPWADYA